VYRFASGQENQEKVLSMLEKLSMGSHKDRDQMYAEAYGDAINRIEDQRLQDCALAKKALSWITYAQETAYY
jgi:hypothetical protein